MSFVDNEKTIHDGQPIELYEFNVVGGDATAYRYTDHYEDLNVLSETWTSVKALQRSVISAGNLDEPPEVFVEMPFDTSIVDDVIIQQPPRSVELIVQRYHGQIADVGQVWKGKVLTGKIVSRTAMLRVPSLLSAALNTLVPTVSYQALCNHVLYDTQCGVLQGSFGESRSVGSISSSGLEVTFTTLSEAAAEYIGGFIQVTSGDNRLIVDGSGLTLTIMRPFRALAPTDLVSIFQGCNHEIGTCDAKFDNLISNGGHPYLPTVDVHRAGLSGSGV